MMKQNLLAKKAGFGGAAILAIFASLLTACENRTANNPNVSPTGESTPTNTTTVVATPSPVQTPSPTTTVVISPTPVPVPAPTTTVVVTPTPVPTTSPTGGLNSPNAQVSPNPTATVVPGQPITNVGVITGSTNQQSLYNTQVQLSNATVQNVNGDRTFWVTQNNSKPLLVVLAPPLDEGSAENKIVMKPGQNVNITGVLQPMPTQQQVQQQWGLTANEAKPLQSEALYLQARQVQFK